MPDLSELLGNVYGGSEEPEQSAESSPEPAAEPSVPPAGPRTPEWADDEHLDRAFADWTPGLHTDAPAAERELFAPAPPRPAQRLADDLAAALSEAVLAEADEAESTHHTVAAEAEAEVTDSAVVETPRATEVTTATLHDLEPEPVHTYVHKAGWQRNDDDILPRGGKGGGISFRANRAPKAPREKRERKSISLPFRKK